MLTGCFRPPAGSKVSERQQDLFQQRKAVSVPSRGVRYLNLEKLKAEYSDLDGFRPLSGSKVSERYNYYEYSREWKKFPSPRGD